MIQLYVEDEDPEGGGAGLLPTSMDLCHQYLMVLAWANEWEQALEFFFKLVERGQPHPDQNCYNAVLHALNRSDRWEETIRVMEAFRSHVRLMQHQQLEAPKPMRSLFLSALSTLLRVVSACLCVERSLEPYFALPCWIGLVREYFPAPGKIRKWWMGRLLE